VRSCGIARGVGGGSGLAESMKIDLLLGGSYAL
jgi:hypothetical protein